MADRPTLSEVARAAGVGRATVARVFMPEGRYPISADMRRRVQEAAERLGYRPSWGGRALATGRTGFIALLHPEHRFTLAGVLGDLVQSLVLRLGEQGLMAVHMPVDDAGRWRTQLADGRFDGCLVLPPHLPELGDAPPVPLVLVNQAGPPGWPQVLADDAKGSHLLVEHLAGLGHRRLAFLPPERAGTHYSLRERPEAAAVRADGLGLSWTPGAATGPAAWLDAWLAADPGTRPTALIVYSSALAVELLQAAWQRGVRVPGQLSVAAYNDDWAARTASPPLTVVRTPVNALADHAVAMLDAAIGGAAPGGAVRLAGQLVARASTAAPGAA